MNGIVLVLAAAATGVDVGWQPVAGGGFEYIIQIEPEALEAMKAGEDIVSQLPSHLHNVRQYRITIGTGPLPRVGMPPEMRDAGAPGGGAPVVTPRPSPADRTARGPAPAIERPTELDNRPPAVDDPFPAEPTKTSEQEAADEPQKTIDPFTRDPLTDPFENPIRRGVDDGAAAASANNDQPGVGSAEQPSSAASSPAGSSPVSEQPDRLDAALDGGSNWPPRRTFNDQAPRVGDRYRNRLRDGDGGRYSLDRYGEEGSDDGAGGTPIVEGGASSGEAASSAGQPTEGSAPQRDVNQPADPTEIRGAPGLERPSDPFDWNFPSRDAESSPAATETTPKEPAGTPSPAEGAEATPRPFLNKDDAVRLAASFPKPKSQTEKSKPEPVQPKPWLPLTFTLLGLFVSMGGNAYLSWITLGLRRQYAALLDRFKQRRQDQVAAQG